MFPHSVECRGKLKIVKIRRQRKIDAATATKKKKDDGVKNKLINVKGIEGGGRKSGRGEG